MLKEYGGNRCMLYDVHAVSCALSNPVDQPDGHMAGLDVDSISGRSPTLTYSRYSHQVNIQKTDGKITTFDG